MEDESTGKRPRDRRPGGHQAAAEDLRVAPSIEHTKPGTQLDDQLRREQAKAILDLLAANARDGSDDADQ